MPDMNKAYSWAIQTCNAPDVGYSQAYRNQQTVGGITYYDCSSFINYALLAAGFETPSYAPNHNAFTTSIEASVLLSLGFTEVSATGEYKAGDIGWVSGHTEMCYQGGNGNGIFMGAHTDQVALPNQVSIGTSDGNPEGRRSFTRLFRYGDGDITGYGVSIYVVSAIAGNFWQESTLSPALWQGRQAGTWTDLGVGYGLGQWTNTGGDSHGRLYQLHEWLSENGYADDDGNAQMQYLIHENTWYSTEEAAAFENLQAFLDSDSTDIEMLTHAFNIGWEGIHDSSWDARVGYANQCYIYILNHANDSAITEWIAKNDYLTTDERLNNAVMLYRFLSAGGGGGGTPSQRKRKGLPVWAMIRRYY